MSELFKKFFLKLRNTYPFLFYKTNVMEIALIDNEKDLSYSYIYDAKKIYVFVNYSINNVFMEKEKYDLIYFTLYKNDLHGDHIYKILNYIYLNNMDEKSLLIIFLPDSYTNDYSSISDNHMNKKIENYNIWIYYKNIEKLDI